MLKKLLLTFLLIFSLVGNCFAAGNDANTVSLLHMDGADTSTTFTDDAAGGTHTWTANGNAQLDTAQSVFGGASGLFDGTGDNISTGDSADFAFGSGDFTIDCWVRFSNLDFIGSQQYIFHQTDGSAHWGLQLHDNGDSTWSWEFYSYNGSGFDIFLLELTTVSINTWYHIAIIRNGNNFKMFQDGVQVGSDTVDTSAMPDIAGNMYIGAFAGTSNFLRGWLDEVRISKGVARWTANFTPPTEAYSAAVAGPQGQIIWIE